MDIILHVIMISAILCFSVLVYRAFYKDSAKKAWKDKYLFGWNIFPENDFPSYEKDYKRTLLIILIGLIVIYVFGIVAKITQ